MSVAVLPKLPEGFTVTAHSGSEGTQDNSMEFLIKCAQLKVQVLEIDLTFRRDGTPVMIHKDIAENSEGVPFEAAIKYISESFDGVKVNTDIKSVANLPAAVEIIDRYGLRESCFYTGVGEDFVEAVKRDGGGLPYFLNLSLNVLKKKHNSELQKALSKVKAAGAIGINCNLRYASDKMVRLFHDNGLLVSYWTANSEKEMRKLLALAPDNITTRHPVMLNELIRQGR